MALGFLEAGSDHSYWSGQAEEEIQNFIQGFDFLFHSRTDPFYFFSTPAILLKMHMPHFPLH